ncbi:uncharacterized protein N7484_003710 [Penicillium longicatenatum]|uniref:uncharacterized protein n=1 Tax=Penicillium longicatenatum TaxID=1561947 RepID=UPI002548F4CC|nr:uncharacterized protein N7484_003710 [Penicillium longicatenatum]KAJ5649987.1 hypothetical protein N7484_003710 [Penicillium longicatenatum]
MATPRISSTHLNQNSPQWQHLLRATLRECTYLPDPIARTYMHGYILDRYRRAFQSKQPEAKLIHTAKKELSRLQRANQGYPRPLDRVMMMSYGRIGKRRHELLAELMNPDVPTDTNALRELVTKAPNFTDGWEPPQIILSLIKSQMNNGVVTSSRIRPQLKGVEPPVPEKNSWGRPLGESRKANIRHKWYFDTLFCLLPPLPDKELKVLDGLIAGTVLWKPRKRKQVEEAQPPQDNLLLDLLADGPQKGPTFRPYLLGRPHQITPRFMARQWRRISALVPRKFWNEKSAKPMKWIFHWDDPKKMPTLAFDVDQDADVNEIFGESSEAKSTPESSTKTQTPPTQ